MYCSASGIVLVFVQKNYFIFRKIRKNIATRAALFGSNMHEILRRLGFRPRPHLGSLQRSPRPSVFRGLLLRVWGEGNGRRVRKGGAWGWELEEEWRGNCDHHLWGIDAPGYSDHNEKPAEWLTVYAHPSSKKKNVATKRLRKTITSRCGYRGGQGAMPPRSPRPKFVVANVCRIQGWKTQFKNIYFS